MQETRRMPDDWKRLSLRLMGLALLFGSFCAAAGEPFDLNANYERQEVQISMRDGVTLYTALFIPKRADTPLPFLMTRTNYGGFFPHEPSEELARLGYIFVFQDARGTYRSGGSFLEYSPRRDRKGAGSKVDESTDTHDTVEWLLSHVPGNNGKVGIYGGSYEGFYVSASIANSHPAIKAADIEIMGEWNYKHGAMMLGDNFEFYVDYRPKDGPDAERLHYWTRDPYEFFLSAGTLHDLSETYFKRPNPLWTDQVTHSTYDAFWKERDFLAHLRDIHCAVLNVGGWFDQYVPGGPIGYYKAIARNNPSIVNSLVMGPWNHTASLYGAGRRLGNIDFGTDTASYYRDTIRNPFFEWYLKGKGHPAGAVTVFETGSNVWRQYPQWPPPGVSARTLYFNEGGALSTRAPDVGDRYDEYVSDPAKPVPFMQMVSTGSSSLMPPEFMTGDQRFASRRPDVLVYQTPPLDEALTVAGPINARLFVSTSGTDSDWVVKVIDVYPADYPEAPQPTLAPAERGAPLQALAGYQLLVRGEPMRGKYRAGWDRPKAFIPGQPEPLDFELADINHSFGKGHRIMVQVQSSWFPVIDLNPQSFMEIANARRVDFHPATQRVYRAKDRPSALVIQTLNESPSTRELLHYGR